MTDLSVDVEVIDYLFDVEETDYSFYAAETDYSVDDRAFDFWTSVQQIETDCFLSGGSSPCLVQKPR